MSDHATPPADPVIEAALKEQAAFDTLLADLQAKNPDADVEPFTYSGGRLILRTPSSAHVSQWMDSRAARPVQAADALCLHAVLHPSAPELRILFSRKPLLTQRIADRVLEKAGFAEEINRGK